MPNNPERPSQANEIPEWQSLINDEVLDLERKPTDEYLNSRAGQKALEEEQKLYRHAEMIDQRIAECDRILASESSTEEAREHAEKFRQRYLDLKDKLLDKTIKAVDAYRQDYAEGRGGEDIEALWSKLEYMERGEKANEAAQADPASATSKTTTTPAPVETTTTTPAPAEATTTTPAPTTSGSESAPESESTEKVPTLTPDLQKAYDNLGGTLNYLEDLNRSASLSPKFYERIKEKIEKTQKLILDIAAKRPDGSKNYSTSLQFIASRNRDIAEEAIKKADYAIALHRVQRQSAEEDAKKAAVEEETFRRSVVDAVDYTGKPDRPLEGVAEREVIDDRRLQTARRKRGARAFFGLAAATVLTASILAGIFSQKAYADNRTRYQSRSETAISQALSNEQDQSSSETEEKAGIHDGYEKPGMWTDKHKSGPNAFANATVVGEECGNDMHKMIKYVAHNQVESMADYVAHIPDQLLPDEFHGKTILECEGILENMSDEAFSEFETLFRQIIDQATFEVVRVDGEFDNAYMRKKNEANPELTHENMELVRCTTEEHRLVVKASWHDEQGEEIGSMLIKMNPIYNDEGEIVAFDERDCTQVIKKAGSSTHADLPEIQNETGGSEEGHHDEEHHDEDSTDEDTTDDDEEQDEEEQTEEQIQQKDAENLQRIDGEILEDIAEDIDSDAVTVDQTSTEEVEGQTPTDKPSAEDYQGTEATIDQSDSSENATPVASGEISPENNYSAGLSGAHAGEYAPVQVNTVAQAAADAAETPIAQAPTEGQELDSALTDLGI